MPLTLHTSIDDLYMVGEKYAEVLKKYLNIHTVEDLLYHFPFRYEDLTAQKSISELRAGETVTLTGQILAIQNIKTRTGKQIQQAIFTDGQQTLKVTWFNQPFLAKTFMPGTRVNLAGKVEQFGRQWQMTSPKYETIRDAIIEGETSTSRLPPSQFQTPQRDVSTFNPTHTGGIIPIYPETFGITSKWLRSRIKPLIKHLEYLVEDWLPEAMREGETSTSRLPMVRLQDALRMIHFPESWDDVKQAQKRLAFDEMFLLQLKTQHRIAQWHQTELRHHLRVQEADLKPLLEKLPFELTSDQKSALTEMIQDLNKPVAMNRLLEGDVGSGKTIVAAALMYLVWRQIQNSKLKTKNNGLKSILIAPTEVLAHQHLASLTKVFEPIGLKIGFFTGSKKSTEPIEDFDIYLGTHALLFQDLPHDHIALVIIDEQHRFGVEQRAKLLGNPKTPHVLSMTATPIPRTVALSLYGDLTLSVITTKPAGRKPIKTWVVPNEKRKSGLAWIAKQLIKEGTQAYFIYPLIDPSDKEAMANIKAAKAEYEALQKVFPDFNLGLLHGKMKPKDKQAVMEAFARHELHILVSTSVIEVGIDVPNATIIVIEGAERFGLAALHQLRGRVGRGDKQSYCLLFTSTKDKEEARRLKAMETTQSGLELAELDLKLRGPGELYGTQQSGFLELKIASLSDHELLSRTQQLAQTYYLKLADFPLLQEKLKAITITEIKPN